MLLWTIQNHAAYATLLETGLLRASEEHALFASDEEVFRMAYDWMARKMVETGIQPPAGVRYPVWAWYQWEGKRKRRDLRSRGLGLRGEKYVQLTINVPENQVLLSDFDMFHSVLNKSYLSVDEADDEAFDQEFAAAGYSWGEWQNVEIQTEAMQQFRRRIEQSWDRIFDLSNPQGDDWTVLPWDRRTIQATLWEVRQEQVIKAEVYVARG